MFDSSPLTAGPWSRYAQHGGPPSALLAREIERYQPRDGHRIRRMTVDFLSPVPVAPLRIRVESLRRTRRVELLQATASAEERPILVARAWRVAVVPDGFPGQPTHVSAALPAEASTSQTAQMFPDGWYPDGYLSAIEWRSERGGFGEFGPAKVWTRARASLIDGETMSQFQRVLVVADSGSGISACAPPREHPAINCDFSVALHRDPVGEWVCLDSETVAVVGQGAVAYTRLLDTGGEIGTGTQILVAG